MERPKSKMGCLSRQELMLLLMMMMMPRRDNPQRLYMAGSTQMKRPSILLLCNSGELKKVFDQFDLDNNGKLSLTELSAVMTAMGCSFSHPELKQIMADLDANDDGFIDMAELESICRSTRNADLRKAFDAGDKDKNGLLSAEELQVVLSEVGISCSVGDCGRMIKSVDSNSDGNLNFDEFTKMITKPCFGTGTA